MATLAYAVGQSTSSYNTSTIKSVLDVKKPSGTRQLYSAFPTVKIPLDLYKLNGNSQSYSKFVNLQIPLDTKKLSLKINNSDWVPSTSSKLKATVWIPTQLGGVGKTNISNLKTTSVGFSSWAPPAISFEKSNLVSLKSTNLTIGILSTPYTYESLAGGAMRTTFITLANPTTIVPVEKTAIDSFLTIKVGAIGAFGAAPNHGWIN